MASQQHEIWGHPRGLALLFFTEMWERFSYYGMRAIFSLYMINALLFSKAKASEIYGSYTGLVYLTPLIGGYVADRYWGNRKSIVAGGLLMAIGQFFMFFSASAYQNVGTATTLMWTGLVFLIVGNGFFKPNISSMIGQMYTEGDRRRDAAYTIFYMGINLGAFIAPLVCGFLGDTGNPADFKWGFLAAGIGMVFGTILFQTQKDKYVITPDGNPIGAVPNTAVQPNASQSAGLGPRQLMLGGGLFVASTLLFWKVAGFDLVGAFIYAAIVAMIVMIITDPSLTKIERDRIIVLFVSAFFVVFFWAAFEQAGASLTFFAEEQTNRSLLGWTIPASYFQSVNAVSVVLLAPVMAGIWVFLSKRKAEPNSLAKQAFGLIILALGYVVIAIGVKGLGLGMRVSMFWLIALYVIHTIGELCLSPIGLSLVSKLSPMRFVSLLFGVWFLANATANKAAGQLSALYPPSGAEFALAEKNGIDESTYRGLLEGSIQPTPEQIARAQEASLPLKYPNFLGSPVKDLYQFFILFVGMSGIAGLILFGLSFPMKKMMHGAD
ncbi:MAG: peptide MFS transporter [Saprospiraceae bacterium]|nr:peptide MFS transporter [Saprospiraceae bacterium]